MRAAPGPCRTGLRRLGRGAAVGGDDARSSQQQLPGHRADRCPGQHRACRDLCRGGYPVHREEVGPPRIEPTAMLIRRGLNPCSPKAVAAPAAPPAAAVTAAPTASSRSRPAPRRYLVGNPGRSTWAPTKRAESVLQSVGETTATEKGAQDTDCKRKRVAERGNAELIMDLAADDGELGECRIHQVTLKLRVFRNATPRIVVSASRSGKVAMNA